MFYMDLIETIIVITVFFAVKFLGWKITEEWGLPVWLQYKPWICNTCLCFWSLLAIYLILGLVFNLYITLIFGLILTVLDTIAVLVHQHNNTISINDFDYDDNK